MTRVDGHPTARAAPGIRALTDRDAPDFLDAAPVAVLAFVAGDDPASQKLLAKLTILEAKLAVPIGSLDVDRQRVIAAALHVKRVPELVVFAGGEVVDRLMGVPPEAVIVDVVRARIKPPS